MKFTLISDQATFQHEVEVYARLDTNPHPNLCRLLTHYHQSEGACLIFESALMDLRDFMSAGQLLPELVHTACLHLSRGLEALHQHGIIHRDLKPNNILVKIEAAGILFQIADFRVARVTPSSTDNKCSADMTPGLAAPWASNKQHYQSKMFLLKFLIYLSTLFCKCCRLLRVIDLLNASRLRLWGHHMARKLTFGVWDVCNCLN